MFNDEVIIKSQQRFRSDHHKVYTEEVNKIALSSNDDKRVQTFDKVTIYPYVTNAFMVCENEMLSKNTFSDKVNSELQVLRKKSQELRNEAQSLRNESQELRNELKELKNKSQSFRNESQVLRNEAQVLRNKAQIHKNKSWILRSKSQVLREKSQNLRSEAYAIRNRSEVLRLEPQALRNILFKSDEETCMPLIERNITFSSLEDALDTTSLFEGLETDSSSDEDDVIDDIKERPTHLDKTNELIDQVEYAWKMIYAENREKHEITNINIDKDNEYIKHHK